MPISGNQVPGALTTIGQMITTLNTISALLNEAQVLINQNWVVTLVPGVNLTITPDQQSQMVAQYDTLKAQIATEFSNLP